MYNKSTPLIASFYKAPFGFVKLLSGKGELLNRSLLRAYNSKPINVRTLNSIPRYILRGVSLKIFFLHLWTDFDENLVPCVKLRKNAIGVEFF